MVDLNSRKIVVFGATGFVGQHLMKDSFWQNVNTAIVSRRPYSSEDVVKNKINVQTADLLSKDQINSTLRNATDIIYMAYLGHPENDLAALRNVIEQVDLNKLERFVYLSTATVTGQNFDLVSEQTKPNPANSYQATKLSLENEVFRTLAGLNHLYILRPTAVFGVGGANLNKLIDSIKGGSLLINYLKSAFFHFRSMNLIPVGCVTSAIIDCLKSESQPTHKVKILSCDDEDLNTFNKIEAVILKKMNRKYVLPVVALPKQFLEIFYYLFKREKLNATIKYKSLYRSNSCSQFETELTNYISHRIQQ